MALMLPLEFTEYPPEQMLQRAQAHYALMAQRRSVRQFSDRAVPKELIAWALRTAGSAPNGANLQPWTFVVVSNPQVKQQIRQAAEEEEQKFYAGRAPQSWLQTLAPLGTDAHKPFLQTAPYLIAIFAQTHGFNPDGSPRKHYYVQESVGIATGMLITALHHMGLATLTHTPSPMGFLNDLLQRPTNERPFLLLVVGYPAHDAQVPQHASQKKSLQEFAVFVE